MICVAAEPRSERTKEVACSMHPKTRTSDPSATGRVHLTDDGRRWLEQRVASLRRQLEAARRLIEDDPDTWESGLTTVALAEAELDEIEWTLQRAGSVDEIPDDPAVVQIGDAAQLRFHDGTDETYVLVHTAEAHVDDTRISAESPLGRAVLARPVGETVDVTTPDGSYSCTIISARRLGGAA